MGVIIQKTLLVSILTIDYMDDCTFMKKFNFKNQTEIDSKTLEPNTRH